MHLDKLPFRLVPNVPCGVERRHANVGGKLPRRFLMYRVELKG